SSQSENENASLLAFKHELSNLKIEEARLKEELEAALAAKELAAKQLAEFEEKAVDLQSLIIKVERGIISIENQLALAQQEAERAQRHSAMIEDELILLDTETLQIKQKIEEARTNAHSAHEQRLAAEKDLEEISRELSKAREAAEAESDVLNRQRTEVAALSERLNSAQNALKRAEMQRREISARIESERKELTATADRIDELNDSLAELDKLVSSSRDIRQSEAEAENKARSQLTEARLKADELSRRLADANREAAEAMNLRARFEVERAEFQTSLNNLAENCRHELGIPLDQAEHEVVLPVDFDLVEARERVEQLKERLDSFGAINMLAVEELEEAEERLAFLEKQRQDIVDSITASEEALREIKERSRERFLSAFESINANFSELFAELFGGGSGSMSLLDVEDVLESGIEVSAQPPGKKLQNINLLSGGEKAMTAIALVMAIFRYRPSPFCLLDEVDAPLDDANVGRFVGKIAEMSEKTQFIVITHNKRTMEAARALYGVTMQEAGVSKVVSVRFE
ncbi:MAG TPA: hypothetical protein VNK26_02635, partial [Pyrinomonadaceae bacterium]|nr:hypothetical protein [Pyrinomonadaceae bacterium]